MKKKYLLIAAAITLVFGACQKENTTEEKDNSTTTQSLEAYYQENRTNSMQHFIVDANAPIELTGEQGTKISIAANNFLDANGNVYTGEVEVKLTEVFTKLDMVKTNMTTMTADGEMPVSGGEFYFDVTLPGTDQSLRAIEPMRVVVPAAEDDPRMKLWRNVGNGWELMVASDDRDPDGIMEPWDEGFVAGLMTGGWFNFDWAPPGDFCDICVRVPEGTDPSTTNLLISVDGQMVLVEIDASHFNGVDMYCFEAPQGSVISIILIQMDPATGSNMYNIVYSITVECGMMIDASELHYGSIGQMEEDIMDLP